MRWVVVELILLMIYKGFDGLKRVGMCCLLGLLLVHELGPNIV